VFYEVLDDVARVLADTGEHGRRLRAQPGQPHGVETWLFRDTARVPRISPVVEIGKSTQLKSSS
jgi:hypothetical protein